jgi:hypothetical protein
MTQVAKNEIVASLEAQGIFQAAEWIATQRIAQINDALARYRVQYRVFPGEARLTEAAMALAEAQNDAHTRIRSTSRCRPPSHSACRTMH